MKKIIVILLALLSMNLWAEGISVKQGVTFVPGVGSTVTTLDKGTAGYNKENFLAGTTTALIDYKYVNGFIDVDYAKNYIDLESRIEATIPNTIEPYIRGTYKYISYKVSDIVDTNVMYGDLSVGVRVTQEWSIFKVQMSAFVGWQYVDFSKNLIYNKYNLSADYTPSMITGFDIKGSISDYVDVYFAIESTQHSTSEAFSFAPVAILNKFGADAHYDFNNHFGLYASVEHICKHPEIPNNRKYNYYNLGYTTITVGAKVSL